MNTSDRLTQLEAFRAENPEDPFLHYAVATELLKLGRRGEALEGFEALVQSHPDYVGTYYHLGKAYEEDGRLEDAVGCYQRGMVAAQKAGDRHALGELRAAWQLVLGEEEDEDDY